MYAYQIFIILFYLIFFLNVKLIIEILFVSQLAKYIFLMYALSWDVR